jgi:subtilisin family serine protease
LSEPPLARHLADSPKALDAAGQQSYLKRLRLAQEALLAALSAAGIKVVYRYQKVLNGVQVQCSECSKGELLALPGVVQVHPVMLLEAQLDNSVPHIGAGSALAATGIDGKGVNIGIIDSGIDYLHEAFGGVGVPNAYAVNDAASIEDLFEGQLLFPTAKVVGGYDLAGNAYVPGQVDPKPDSDPMPDYVLVDVEGQQLPQYADHGTHVAGIAAGIGSEKVPAGVAPGANLWAIKITSQAGTTLTTAGIEWAADPNGDGNLDDALDVLNISLGSSFSGRNAITSAEAMAIANFVTLGGVVVASAGNAGNIPMVVSSPSAILEAISVAATRAPGEVGTFLQVESPPALVGMYTAKPASTKLAPPLDDAGPFEGELVFVGQGCSTGDYGDSVSGAIALIERKGCKFGVKFAMAQIAGAIAVVVIQKQPGSPSVMFGTPKSDIPGVMIEQDAGQAIREALEAGETVSIFVGNDFPVLPLIDTIWNSSSLGPGFPFRDADNPIVAKPDICAPGARIDSVLPGLGNEKRVASGTSMAAPHIAGAAALLKQKRPDWNAREIKAALVNTANPRVFLNSNPDHGGDGVRAPVSRMGAGRVNVTALLQSDVVAYSEPQVAINFGLQSMSAKNTLERNVLVANKGISSRSYSVSFEMRREGEALGVTYSASLPELTIAAGSTAELTVSVLLEPEKWPNWQVANPSPTQSKIHQGNLIIQSEFDGHLLLSSSDDAPDLRLPIYLLVRPVTELTLGPVCLSNQPFVVPFENAVPQIAGRARLFTMVAEDIKDEWSHPSVDIRALGIGLGAIKDQPTVQFAINTWGPRIHPSTILIHIYIDTDLDGFADFILLGEDEGRMVKHKPSGRMSGALLRITPNNQAKISVQTMVGTYELVYKLYAETDLMSANIVLSARLSDLGIDPDNPTFRYWLGTWDLKTPAGGPNTAANLLPEGVNPWEHLHSNKYYSFSMDCTGWVFDSADVNLLESNEASVNQAPGCGKKEVDGVIQPPGIMVLVNNSPGPSEALLVRAEQGTPFVCPEQSNVEIGEGCTLEPDYSFIVSPDCGDYVTADGDSPLALGTHATTISFQDVWGKAGQCETSLVVSDSVAPLVTCPPEFAKSEPGAALKLSFEVTDHCLESVAIESVECVQKNGGSNSACSVEHIDSIALVSGFDGNTKVVQLKIVAQDTTGNQSVAVCEVELAHPPPKEEPGGGGCSAAPIPRYPAPYWCFLLVPLLLLARRRRI